MTEYLNYRNVDLEKLGFIGLPKNLSYFKFEVGSLEGDPQIAEVTVRYYPNVEDISNRLEKKYRLIAADEGWDG